MRIYYSSSVKDNRNRVRLHGDRSFDSLCGASWDYSVSLNESSTFILNFCLATKECVGSEGYFDETSKYLRRSEITVSEVAEGTLKIALEPSEATDEGRWYLLKDTTITYDSGNSTIAFGKSEGALTVEFGGGQYAVFSNAEELVGIIIKF